MKKIFLGLIVLIILVGIYVMFFTNMLDKPNYMKSDGEIYLNGEIYKDNKLFIEKNSEIYVDSQWIIDNDLADVLWDEKNKVITFFDGRNIYRFSNEDKIMKNEKLVEIDLNVFFNIDDNIMINIKFLELKTNYMYEFQKELNRLIIINLEKYKNIKVSNRTLQVKKDLSYFSESVDLLKKGELYFQLNNDNWANIITPRGKKGYINNNMFFDKMLGALMDIENIVVPIGIENIRTSKLEDQYKKNEFYKQINMTWNHFITKTPNSNKLKSYKGIDVISPTWFSLKNDLSIRDIGTMDYMNWANTNNYDVWILFSNGFDPERTSLLVNDSIKRSTVIKDVIGKTLKYKAKGINIDFENVYYRDKDMLTQFIKELYANAKNNGLILSMDVTFKSKSENWSMCYDRKSLSKYLDYIIIMAYDEYWAGRGEAGPVSSIPWVEKNLLRILEEVPNNQVILGIPFYTRVWEENYRTNKITSKAYSMKSAEKFIEKYSIEIKYDNKMKLNFGEVESKDKLYKIWLEDMDSLNKRIDIAKNAKLAGVASWRKGFEKKEVWELLNRKLDKKE